MEHLARIFKILSDETRLRILLLLLKEELCVCQIGGILNAPQPKISKNLSKLKDVDLVQVRRDEKYMYYSIKKNQQVLIRILDDIWFDYENDPIFQQDLEQLKNKEHFLNQCK
ncbi:MAG TPA: transcriptional regulator [Eubacteriaceae bacterium]|nr:transcriptional regulator [Eubacteriaceae bacterium]